MEDKMESLEEGGGDANGGDSLPEGDVSMVPVLGAFLPSEALTAGYDDEEDLMCKETAPGERGYQVIQSRDVGAANEHAWKCACVEESDGGDAWLAAVMVIIITFSIATEFSTFGIYYVEYTEQLTASKASIGWIKGIQTIAGGSFGVFGGTFVKVYGCRRIAFIGTFCAFVGMMTASLSPDVHTLYLTQGILLGIGHNMMNISAAVIIQLHFTKNPVLGSGVAFMGYTIGSIVSPLLISALLDTFGLRGALLIHSAIIAQGMPASLLLRTPRAKQQQQQQQQRRSNGLQMDAAISSTKRRPLSSQLKEELCDLSLLKDVKFCLLAIAGLLLYYTISTFVNHMPGRAVYYGLTRSRAAYLQPVISTSSTLSRIASTLFANWKRVNKLTFFCVVIWFLAAGPLSYAFVTDFNTLVIPPIIFGIGMGGSTTVFLVVLVHLFGIEQLPKALGFYTIATSMGLSLGPPISGIIFDKTHNYDIPFILAGCVCVCANIFFVAVMSLHHRRTVASRKNNQSKEDKL